MAAYAGPGSRPGEPPPPPGRHGRADCRRRGRDRRPGWPGHDKTSLCFTLPDAREPGSLYRALACFAEAGINLTKLESRPSKAELGLYIFLIDLEGHQDDPVVTAALAQLRERAEMLKIFGSYPRRSWPNGERGRDAAR